MSVNESMTALANAIRAKAGVSGALTIDGMTAAVDGITVGSEAYIIKAGLYTLSATPDVSFVHTGKLVSDYLYADMPLLNPMSLIWGYGLNIENGKIILLSAPVSITYTLTGTTIYQNGAYVNSNSNKYRVGCDVSVTKDFYDWWAANTTQ